MGRNASIGLGILGVLLLAALIAFFTQSQTLNNTQATATAQAQAMVDLATADADAMSAAATQAVDDQAAAVAQAEDTAATAQAESLAVAASQAADDQATALSEAQDMAATAQAESLAQAATEAADAQATAVAQAEDIAATTQAQSLSTQTALDDALATSQANIDGLDEQLNNMIATAIAQSQDLGAAEATNQALIATIEAQAGALTAVPTATALAPTTTANLSTGDWTVITTNRTTFKVPPRWVDVTHDADLTALSQQGLDALDLDPLTRDMFEQAQQDIASGLYDAFVIDPITGSNMVVMVQDVNVSPSLDLLASTMESTIRSAGAEDFIRNQVDIPIGPAVKLQYSITLDPSLNTQIHQTMYVTLVDHTIYAIALTVLPNVDSDVDSLFSEVVNSFQVVEAPAVPMLPGGTAELGENAGELQVGAQQAWTYNGEAGEVLTLSTLTESDSALDTVISIYDPDGTLLAQNDDVAPLNTDSQIAALQLPTSGEYTIVVGSYQDAGDGSYRLIIENASEAQAES